MNVLEKILEEIDEEQNGYEADHAWNYSKGLEYAKEIIRSHMDEVPDNNAGWIPVSEKLPEENDGKYYPMLNVSTSYGAVKWGFYRVRDKEWYIYSEMHGELIKAEDKEVIAWQPLPEPYKEE